MDPNVPIFHLTAVAFDANRAGRGQLEGRFQQLAIACAASLVVSNGDHELIPILRMVILEILVRTRDEIVAALDLASANEDTAVGVRCRSKIEFQREVARKVASRCQLLNSASFGRSRDNQSAANGAESPVARSGFAVE